MSHALCDNPFLWRPVSWDLSDMEHHSSIGSICYRTLKIYEILDISPAERAKR